MSKKKPITFDRKISQLWDEKSKLRLSFWEKQKEDYKHKIEELLKSPVEGWEDAISKMKKFKKYYEKLDEIDDKIANLPENAEDAIRKIDDKISFYKGKRKETRSIPLYRETEQWIADVFWENIIHYAKKTNNTELINKLKNRSLTPDEYAEFYDYDYDKHEEMQKLYDELFNLSEEKKTSENDNQLEENTQSSTIRRNIEKPRDTLSKLTIWYQTLDWIILPTNWNTSMIRRSKAVSQGNKELAQEYEDKINILFSKVLTPENWFEPEDYNVIVWMEPKHMVRRTTYVIVEIPQKNKMLILNNGYWEATFLCDEMFEKSLLTSVSKEELVKNHWDSIKKLEFRDEETWTNEVLQRLGETWKISSEEKVSGVDEKNLWEKTGENPEEEVDVDTENWIQENVQENTDEKEEESMEKEIEEENEDDNNIIAELESKIPIRPEEDLTKEDTEAMKNMLERYFNKDDDFKGVVAYVLQRNGWGLVVLKNKELKSFLSKYEEWTRKNGKLVEKELKKIKIHSGRFNSQAENLAKLNLFMSMYFEDEVKKMAMNYKELKKMLDENSELIENLKELEANLWLNRVDSDNVKNRMNQGDIEIDRGIKYSILYILNKCEKMFENGTMNDWFCESCKKVIEFLSEYKSWFMGNNNEWEIKIPNVETLLNLVDELHQNGVIDDEGRDSIKKQLDIKSEFEVEKNEFKENEIFINKLAQKNKDIENEFKDLRITVDSESNLKKVGYNLRRIIIETFKKRQRINNILSEYKSHFMDENGDIKENFGIEDAENFINYLFNDSLVDENTAKNVVKLLYVNKILDSNNEEMEDDEKNYIINYIISRGSQSFRIGFNDWFMPEIRKISDWDNYKNLESVLEKLWFVCLSKIEWSQPQKESNTTKVNKTSKNERKIIGDGNSGRENADSYQEIPVFEKESEFMERLRKSENKVDEFRKFIQELEWEEAAGENKKTKLEEIDELNRKFPGALDAYIEECIKSGRLLFDSRFAFKKRKAWKRDFDFFVAQAGILNKAIAVCGITDENLKNIFKHLGFFIRKQFEFEDLWVANFETWIKNIMHIIIKQSYEKGMWCFSDKYWKNDNEWHKIDLQKLPIINQKKADNLFAIWRGNQDYRIGLVGKDGFYVLFKYFRQHDDYSSNRNTGWLHQTSMDGEKKAFLEETGMNLK